MFFDDDFFFISYFETFNIKISNREINGLLDGRTGYGEEFSFEELKYAHIFIEFPKIHMRNVDSITNNDNLISYSVEISSTCPPRCSQSDDND